MPKRTPVYSYYMLNFGDVVYSYYDKRNQVTSENELFGLYSFVGPGILTGWIVSAMPILPDNLPSPLPDSLLTIINEREALRDAAPNTNKYYQYQQLNSPAVENDEDSWRQIIKITTGNGIVGDYSAHTDDDYYIRINSAGYYEVYAIPDISLVSQGLAQITVPVPFITNYLENHVGTFLGNITLTGGIINPIGVTMAVGIAGTNQFTTNVAYDFQTGDQIVPNGITSQSRFITFDQSISPYTVSSVYDIGFSATPFTVFRPVRIFEVNGEDQRINLFNLEGALQQALQLAFYRHVHLGGTNHPSKILLNTELILNAFGPTNTLGSPIFQIKDSTGANFTWKSTDFGVPIIKLNNITLSTSSYVIVPNSGIIYLKNSLPSGSVLQVILPLAQQVPLTVLSTSSINNDPIYLTGTFPSTNFSGQGLTNSTNQRISWDKNYYHNPQVFIKGNLISPDTYTIDPTQGSIHFIGGLPTVYGTLSDSDLIVLLTALHDEVINTLSGKRVYNVDASTFNRGILATTRLPKIDHVGQMRLKDNAVLRPNITLFDSGNHQTYYPQIPNSAIQYSTDVLSIYKTQNFPTLNVILATKRGLMIANDNFDNIQFLQGWNQDNGKPVQIIDNLLNDSPNTNKFTQVYVRTFTTTNNGIPVDGNIFFSDNQGITWNELKLPVIATSTGNITPIPTAFWVSTERIEYYVGSIKYYHWSYKLYLGTYLYGMFHADVQEGQTQADWSWNQINFQDSGGNPQTINEIIEVVTLNQITVDSDTIETYDRSLYVGADDGFYVAIKSLNFLKGRNWLVKNIFWIREGLNKNGLIVATDTTVYITHTAEQIITTTDTPTGTSTQNSWIHPFERTGPFESSIITNFIADTIITSTTSDDDLSFVDYNTIPSTLRTLGTSIIDGHLLSPGDEILIKNFTGINSSPHNGLWIYQGISGIYETFIRTTSLDSNLEASTSKWMIVSGGNLGSNSAWYYDAISTGINSSSLVFHDLWTIGLNTISPETIFSLGQTPNLTKYWILTNENIYNFTDVKFVNNWAYPNLAKTSWLFNAQGSTQAFYPLRTIIDSDLINRTFIIGGRTGLWRTGNDGLIYNRNSEIFTINSIIPPPSVYNSKTGIEVSSGLYTVNQSNQSIVFNDIQSIDKSFLMEKDYQNYFVSPWNNNNADVIIYENNTISGSPYVLSPDLGLIHFDFSRNTTSNIQTTIIRMGAFLNNIGITPHEELANIFVTPNISATTLAQQLLPTDRFIVVTEPSKLPAGNQEFILELRFRSSIERITVIRLDDGSIFLPRQRATNAFTFPANLTNVFISQITNVFGIEDYISLADSNQPYHFNSTAGDNILQLAIATKEQVPQIFEPSSWFGNGTIDTDVNRGLKNAILMDLTTNGQFDEVASANTLDVSLIPSVLDQATAPQSVYFMYNVSVGGNEMEIGTDQGIWKYDAANIRWIKKTTLGGALKVYSIQTINGNLSALTDNGLWTKDASNVWSENITYPETIFDYISGGWFDGNIESYGKNDGIVAVETSASISGFLSDHFDILDNKNVYGLYKDKFFRTDSEGNKKEIDALYVATEIGLYGLTNGSRNSQFSSFLGGREMFGNNQQFHIVEDSLVPVKFYKITHSPRQKAVPLIFLTNDGIKIVRNWRWCDPTDSSDSRLDFSIESSTLQGLSCNCFAWLSPSDDSQPYIIYIGTNKGVYKSTSEGNSWERTERLGGNDIAVFDIKLINNDIIAATQEGIWVSNNGGDNWFRPGDGNTDITFRNRISTSEFYTVSDFSIQSAYKAQVFKTPSNASTLNKISLFFGVDTGIGATDPLRNNKLNIDIFDTDANGIPTNPISGIGTFVYRASGMVSLGSTASIVGISSILLSENNILFTNWSVFEYPIEKIQVFLKDILWKAYSIDNVGGTITFNPPLSSGYLPNDLQVILNANFPPVFGLKSFIINNGTGISINPSTKYALVTNETVQSGTESVFELFKSTLDNPYQDGNAFTGTGSTIIYPASWNINATEDYYFRTFYSGLPIPTPVINNIDFTTGDSIRGLVITTDNKLSTNSKFAIVTIIDNSKSSGWANEEDVLLNQTISYINNTLQTLSSRTLSNSYIDLWFYGNGGKSMTQGFTTSLSTVNSLLSLHTATGLLSDTFDSTMRAIVGLNPQSLIDVNNTSSKIGKVYNYMNSNNLIRIQDFRKDYDLNEDKASILTILSPSTISDASPINLRSNIDTTVFRYNQLLPFTYPFVDIAIGGNSVVRNTYTNFSSIVGVGFTYPVGVGTSSTVAIMDGTNGQITFNPPLSSQLVNTDLQVSLRTDWNGEQSSITTNTSASNYLLLTWAKSFIPVVLLFTDGDNIGSANTDIVTLAANSGWDDDGFPIYIYGMGTSHEDIHLRYIADNTDGFHFSVTSIVDDMTQILNNFLHGGDFTLFKGLWSKKIDFETSTWLLSSNVNYTIPSGTQVTVLFRHSSDRLIWSDWIQISSDVPYILNDFVLAIEWKIILDEGWDSINGVPIFPIINSLSYTNITPSTKFYVSNIYNSDGMLFQHLLSAAQDLPRTAQTEWGIIRGTSPNIEDFENIQNNRKGSLSNRQRGIRYSPQRIRPPSGNPHDGLTTQTSDHIIFTVNESTGATATWTIKDQVDIYVNFVLVDPTRAIYSLNGIKGQVIFTSDIDLSTSTITVVITTPQQIVSTRGELTTTTDFRTYQLINGRWPQDANIIVLVNNNIVRGGFWQNSEEGSITFSREREFTDLVTVYVQHANNFRVGVVVNNYNPNIDATLSNFGLLYTTENNTDLLYQFNNTPLPGLVGAPILENNNGSIYSRMTVDYVFKSTQETSERDSQIKWYRQYIANGEMSVVGIGSTFFDCNNNLNLSAGDLITPDNFENEARNISIDSITSPYYVNLPFTVGFGTTTFNITHHISSFDNRVTEPQSGIGTTSGMFAVNDYAHITVQPSDGIQLGDPTQSNIVIIRGKHIPYAWSSFIVSTQPDRLDLGNRYVPAGSELKAIYKFIDPDTPYTSIDFNPDSPIRTPVANNFSIVEWFNQNIFISTSAIIPSNTTQKGQVINFKVTPFDGEDTGFPIFSEQVIVE